MHDDKLIANTVWYFVHHHIQGWTLPNRSVHLDLLEIFTETFAELEMP